MSKQLKITKKEQNIIGEAIRQVSAILLSKMDKGVANPCVEGTMDVPADNREVLFHFTAQNKS